MLRIRGGAVLMAAGSRALRSTGQVREVEICRSKQGRQKTWLHSGERTGSTKGELLSAQQPSELLRRRRAYRHIGQSRLASTSPT